MLIAKEKRRNNIAEYIIYMWHVEDLLRALHFDQEKIQSQLVENYKANDATKKEIAGWYESLAHMMREQGITESGHLHMLNNTINEMEDLHQKLLKAPGHSDYMKAFFYAKPNMVLFKSKSPNPNTSDIITCFNALYSMLLMKLSGKDIGEATLESMETFSKLLSILSIKFKENEEGKLDL